MKKILQLGSVALAVLASTSYAQDDASKASVSMWGVVDVNYGVTTNVGGKGTQLAAGQGGMYGSRFGVNGKSATLSGGTRAIFSLEGAINPPTPSALQFNRYGFVGLEGGFGRLRLGTTLKPYDDTAWDYDALEGGGAFSQGTITSWRGFGAVNNVIRYNTNDLGNKTVFDVFYSSGGVPGNRSAGTRWGLLGKTSLGPVDLLAYYEDGRDANGLRTQTTQAWNASTGTMAALMSRTKLDKLSLYLGYNQFKAPDAAAGSINKTEMVHAGLTYQATKDLKLQAGYYGLKNSGGTLSNDGSKLFAVGAQYNLGVATVYAQAGNLSNEANATLDITGANGAQPAGLGQTGVKLGLVYIF